MAHTYYAGEGTSALMELKRRSEAFLLGWLAYRAGRNHYNLHGSLEEAVVYGAHALRRWWVWIFFFKVWLFSNLFVCWMIYLRLHDNATSNGQDFIINDGDHAVVVRNGLIFAIPALIAVLVTYSRNVDYSLFQRRLVYRVTRPLCRLLDRVPNWVLYLTVLSMLCFPI